MPDLKFFTPLATSPITFGSLPAPNRIRTISRISTTCQIPMLIGELPRWTQRRSVSALAEPKCRKKAISAQRPLQSGRLRRRRRPIDIHLARIDLDGNHVAFEELGSAGE